MLGDHTIIEGDYIAEAYDLQDGARRDGFQSWTTGPGGVGTGTVTGVIIRNNTIIAFTDPERRFAGQPTGNRDVDGFFEEWVVKNNVVITNHSHGITFLGARDCTVINNTVLDLSTPPTRPLGSRLDTTRDTTAPPKTTSISGRAATMSFATTSPPIS